MPGASDRRDTTTWVVLELTRTGEAKVLEGTIESLLREALRLDPSHPIFIPSTSYFMRGRNITLHLMEGYVFVASGLPEATYFNLEGGPYVRKVLSSRSQNGIRVLNVIPDASVCDMRMKLSTYVASNVREGMQVTVTDGTYNHLEGKVVDVDGEDAHVRFTLRSLDLIAKVPKVFLTPSEDT